nr:unnamed protein product [Callosobruchus chinensis]
MNIQNFVKQKFYNVHTTQPYSSTKNFQKAIQVCVLGGHTPLGRFTSFLLKQNPVLSLLRIQGDRGVDKMGSELSLIDTKCKVKTFEGNEGYADSMKVGSVRDSDDYSSSFISICCVGSLSDYTKPR